MGYLCLAQSEQPSDTVFIKLDHINLPDIVVIDQLDKEAVLEQSATDHQLELQLKQLKGVNLISRGGFAQEVLFRGQADGRIQVRLNGMRIYSACTDRMDPSTSYVVANNLHTAEMASACESHCSNNGLAGSLNLQTKKPTFDKAKPLRFGWVQQYQSNTNGLSSALNLESNTKRWAWRVNGAWLKNENYTAGGGRQVEYSQNEKQNWAVNSVYRITSKRFVQLDFIYDLATDIGYPALPMDVSKAQAFIGGITYMSYHQIGPFQRFNLKLYHNDIYHEMDDTQREDVFMHMDMPGWSQTTGLTLDAFDWKLNRHKLNASAEYYTNFRRAEMTMYPDNGSEPPMFMFTWPDSRIHGLALGLTDHFHWGENHLNTTIRVDYETSGVSADLGKLQWEGMGYEMSGQRSYVLPQLKTALSRKLNKTQAINASIAYGQRGPTTSELYGFYLFNAHDGFDYLGNPDLKAEQLVSTEIGHQISKKKWQFSSTLFLQQYFNYIFGLTTEYDAMTWGANGVRAYDNIASATFWGIEVGGQWIFTPTIKSTASVEYLRGVRPGADLPLVPPLQANVGVNATLKQMGFVLAARMAAEQNYFNMEYGDRYTPGYALIDAAVTYKLPIKKVDIQLEVAANNLLDTYYRDHLNWGGIPSMGRNLIFKVKLNN